MEIEEYYALMDRYANMFFDSLYESIIPDPHKDREKLEEIICSDEKTLQELITLRRYFSNQNEIELKSVYLSIPFFNKYSDEDRIICYLIFDDIAKILHTLSLKKQCEEYSLSQPLFQKAPSLFEHIRTKPNGSKDYELIDSVAFTQINSSEIFGFTGGYTHLDKTLTPDIIRLAKLFPDSNLFIRVNPYKYFSSQPPQILCESAIMPADPNWWKQLELHNRTKTGASYQLDNCLPSENLTQYNEKNIKKIDRLEVIAKRNNSGNLSMMIEELTDITSNNLLKGKCIHLDSDSPYGTPFNEAILNHLDLAINIYDGDSAKERNALDNSLASGEKTTDASYRTHLLRIENVPFYSIFAFAETFFDSKTLIKEWFEDQFSKERNSNET